MWEAMPMTVKQTVSTKWRRRIARELGEDEELLWAGQPDLTMATFRYLFFIAPLGAILLFMLVMVLWIGWDGLRAGELGTILPTGLLLLSLLAVLLLIPWQRWKAGKTCYALSSRRALVFQPRLLGRIYVTSYFPEQLRDARFEPSWWFGPKAGDWVFRRRITVKTTRYYKQGIPFPVREEVARGVKLYGFLMLRNALQIESLIERVANEK
jgi:hypothetical protein